MEFIIDKLIFLPARLFGQNCNTNRWVRRDRMNFVSCRMDGWDQLIVRSCGVGGDGDGNLFERYFPLLFHQLMVAHLMGLNNIQNNIELQQAI